MILLVPFLSFFPFNGKMTRIANLWLHVPSNYDTGSCTYKYTLTMQYTGFIPQLEPVGWGHQMPLLGGESPSVHVLQCVCINI